MLCRLHGCKTASHRVCALMSAPTQLHLHPVPATGANAVGREQLHAALSTVAAHFSPSEQPLLLHGLECACIAACAPRQ